MLLVQLNFSLVTFLYTKHLTEQCQKLGLIQKKNIAVKRKKDIEKIK